MKGFQENIFAQSIADEVAPVGVKYLGRYSGIQESTRRIAHQASAIAAMKTLSKLVEEIDASPAVLWSGKGGAKERILALLGNEV